MNVVGVIGNPRPESRTHGLCRTLVGAVAATAPGELATDEIDLARLGPRVLDFNDPGRADALERVRAADVLVLASPTYKATYSGLLKAFLDGFGHRALSGVAAVPVLLGGAPDHRLAVHVHFAPLLLELGAGVPAGGLFVLESEVESFDAFAAAWAGANVDVLLAGRTRARA